MSCHAMLAGFTVHARSNLLQHTPAISRAACLGRLVVILLEGSEREEGEVALHLSDMGWSVYQGANSVPTNLLAADVATASLRSVIYSHIARGSLYIYHPTGNVYIHTHTHIYTHTLSTFIL